MTCVVCRTAGAASKIIDGNGSRRYECPRCGVFQIHSEAEIELRHRMDDALRQRSMMSHTLRRMQLPNWAHLSVIEKEELPNFWRNDLPSPLEQADNLIVWLGEAQVGPSLPVYETAQLVAAMIGAPLCKDGDDGQYLGWLFPKLGTLVSTRNHIKHQGKLGLILEWDGWERFAELKKRRLDSRTAFMAMKFNAPDVEAALEGCFRPAVRRTAFKLNVLSDPQSAGLIDDKIRVGLQAARFVISDLTHNSFGAYWEAGFGEGRGIPVIYTCERTAWQTSKSHFDTNHLNTIIWSADNFRDAEDRLAATIRATLPGEAKLHDD